MKSEISWNHVGGNITSLPAEIQRVDHNNQKVYVHFSGQEPEFGEVFSGIIVLQLTEQDQVIDSFYTKAKKGSSHSEKKVAFTLQGKFIDSTFSEFHGFWTELGQLYELEIIGLPASDSKFSA